MSEISDNLTNQGMTNTVGDEYMSSQLNLAIFSLTIYAYLL